MTCNKENSVTLVAVGDIFPRIKATFDPVHSILKGADITFGQLELPLSNRGTRQVFDLPPELNRRPGVLTSKSQTNQPRDFEQQLQNTDDAGFNVISFASNHAYIFGNEGIIDTVEALKGRDIACIGAGKDIIEATKPAILKKKGQKVGFLAYCSVVPPGAWATNNKAGVAPLRASTSYEQIDWQAGSLPRVISWCNKDDLAGMVDDIQKLKSQVDIVVVSMHWGVKYVPGVIADYEYEGGHAAIDAGADLIVGHHAHILKGIEVYKGKVIFHNIGHFCVSPSIKISAIEASGLYWMRKFGIRFEVDMEHPYHSFPVEAQKTLMVKCEIADKKIQRVSYVPLWLNEQNQPEIVSRTDHRNEEHLRYMQWLCGSQGLDTKFDRRENDVVIVS